MKKLLVALLLCPLMAFSQEADQPSLYEVVNIKVKAGEEKAFEDAVKAHDAKFHAADPYKARLFFNINGPSGGSYSWIMGPMNYAAMENRPGEGEHDDDWDSVMTHAKGAQSPTYWSLDRELSHMAEGDNSKRVIWMYDIKQGQSKRWGELIGQVKEVYEKKRPTEPLYVVWNEFANTKAGMDAAVIFPFEEWSWMDRKSTFPKLYEELNGAGSWHHFLNEFSKTVDGRVDWMRYQVN